MPVDANSVSKLKQACDAAYDLYPHSCSHAVWHVIKQYLPNQPWMNANALIEHLRGQAHWKVVASGQVGRLAREGVLVVGGKAESSNGHVIVVYPGGDMPAGGYSYTKNGKTETLRTRGNYAPAMSTSLGAWPGAMSKGDKTIWDPWANDAKFVQITFWQLSQ
ncbi:MAG: hypothetical protein KKE41_04015 [Gammaproteobacteria bacterium]|nr:hypothetical protein [Gammaproteobacteria bacterium]